MHREPSFNKESVTEMYEHSELVKAVSSGVVAGTGIVTLPNTSGSLVGTVLAITAITVGGLAIISQLVVMTLRLRAAKQRN